MTRFHPFTPNLHDGAADRDHFLLGEEGQQGAEGQEEGQEEGQGQFTFPNFTLI